MFLRSAKAIALANAQNNEDSEQVIFKTYDVPDSMANDTVTLGLNSVEASQQE